MHVPTVRDHFETVYSKVEGQKQLNYSHLALICTIFTLSVYFSTTIDQENRRDASNWGIIAQDALSASDCIKKPSMEALQSIILIGMHILPNVTGSAWMLRNLAGTEIQLARALGLDQIDSTAANRKRECYNVDPVELEVGRRVWWHLASTEWFMCFISGVPWPSGSYMLHPKQMNVNVPSNTNDVMITSLSNYTQPQSIYTETTFQRFRCEIAIAFREIVDASWEAGGATDDHPYELVLAFDKKLSTLVKELESSLDMIKKESIRILDVDDISGKTLLFHIIKQQRITNIFCIHTRISRLHRPYLIRGAQDPQYAYSRMMCLRSARIVIESSRELMAASPNVDSIKFVAFGHHMFVSTVVLLIDYFFNRDEPRGKERKEEIMECLRVLETSRDLNTIAARGLARLRQVLRRLPENKDGEQQSDDVQQKVQSDPMSHVQPLQFNCMESASFYNSQADSGATAASSFQSWPEANFSMFEDINLDSTVDPHQFEAFLEFGSY